MSRYPERIETARLILRKPLLDDAPAVFEEYASDPDVTRYMIWPTHRSIAEANTFLPITLAAWESGEEISWAITLRGSDRVVGMVALRPEAPFRSQMGYVLARRLWSQGIMSEAAGAVMSLALEDSAVRRVWACCDIENLASARVMEKIGMAREGILRRWVVHPNVSAEPRDSLVYARVR